MTIRKIKRQSIEDLEASVKYWIPDWIIDLFNSCDTSDWSYYTRSMAKADLENFRANYPDDDYYNISCQEYADCMNILLVLQRKANDQLV